MNDPIDYLDSLTAEELEALRPVLNRIVLPEGSYLYRQGDQPENLFIMNRGLAKIMQSTEVGRDIILEFLYPGEICGAICARGSEAYDISAVCLTEVEAFQIPRLAFMQVVEAKPGVFMKAVDVCRRKIRNQRRTFVTMTLQKAEERAAFALLALAGRLGSRDKEGMHVAMPLDRENFSEMIGTTVETAIRALSRLRKKGYIEEHEGEVYMKDEAALRDLARL